MGDIGQQGLLAAAFLVAVSILLQVLACTTNHSAHPLYMMGFYLFTPLPLFLCDSKEDFGEGNGFRVLSNFVLGMFAVSGPCLTMVLSHQDYINTGATVLSLAGGVLTAISVGIVKKYKSQDEFAF
eukprot:TRINITY_DN10419_c0_g1_i2.p1 TRINITY_DN10419_c0_g1~~TRINITY_DN10419_c0_g1_i2.p1  ORF type:complete len:126 (+),score=8.61 TRINITY_DN10419_c0_g1_i2:67-444(+)